MKALFWILTGKSCYDQRTIPVFVSGHMTSDQSDVSKTMHL